MLMFLSELTAWQRKHKLDTLEKENNLKSILLSILKLLTVTVRHSGHSP